VRLLIRIYDVGVVTVMMRVAFETDAPGDLMPFHNPKLETGEIAGCGGVEFCAEVCDSLKGSMVGAHGISAAAGGLHGVLPDRPGGANDANAWLAGQRREVAGLLTETAADRLSEAQVTEVLRIQRSFENTDLAVIDWDAALVVDLTGYVDDVLYALELANLQLEEFRVMDRGWTRIWTGPTTIWNGGTCPCSAGEQGCAICADSAWMWRNSPMRSRTSQNFSATGISPGFISARATGFISTNGAPAWSNGSPSSTSFTASSTRN
jgi:hypothetical protein